MQVLNQAWKQLRPVSSLRPPMSGVPQNLILPVKLPHFNNQWLASVPHIGDLFESQEVVFGVCDWDSVHQVDFDVAETTHARVHPSAEKKEV